METVTSGRSALPLALIASDGRDLERRQTSKLPVVPRRARRTGPVAAPRTTRARNSRPGREHRIGARQMSTFITVLVIVVVVALLVLAMAIRVVKQYERGVLFRLAG